MSVMILGSAKSRSPLIFVSVTVIAIVYAIEGCQSSASIVEPLYRFTGTITDSTTGMPVDSAIVYYSPDAAGSYSDSSGHFYFDWHGSFPSPLTCAKEGYSMKQITIELNPNQYVYDSVNFQLVQIPETTE
jgi:hypothetical protein